MPDPVIESPSGSDNEPNAQSGTPAGNEGGSAGGEGRTPENVYGELTRKHKKLSDKIDMLAQGIKELTDRFGAPQQGQNQPNWQAPAPTQTAGPVSPYGAPRGPLSNFSDQQLLDSLASQTVTPYQKEVIRAELNDRREDQRFEQRFVMRQKQERVNSLKQDADRAALANFPALRDPSSEFTRKVEAELASQREIVGETPTDRFDVANRVARAMNVEVSRAVVPGFIAPAGGEGPRNQQDEVEPVLSDEEIDTLSRRFAHTMPSDIDPKTGRPVRRKFNTKRIKERSQQYNAAQSSYRTRGVKVRGQ